MKILTALAASFALAGCGSLTGPIASRSIQVSGAFGEIATSEARYRTQPLDVYLACKSRGATANCEAEGRAATVFTCNADSMPPSSYALCMRCVSRPDPDDAECRRLAAAIVATPDTSINVGGRTFQPDGTADPPSHPPVGPPPPLR